MLEQLFNNKNIKVIVFLIPPNLIISLRGEVSCKYSVVFYFEIMIEVLVRGRHSLYRKYIFWILINICNAVINLRISISHFAVYSKNVQKSGGFLYKNPTILYLNFKNVSIYIIINRKYCIESIHNL